MDIPDENTGLVDILGLDRLREWRQAVVVLMCVPVPCPAALALGSEKLVVECRHRLVGYRSR